MLRKVKRVVANNRKRVFLVDTTKGAYDFPYSRCEIIPTTNDPATNDPATNDPTTNDPVVHTAPDPELGKTGFLYRLRSGKEDSILCDQILDYHSDPDYLLDLLLYRMSCKAQALIKEQGRPKREIARALKTSPKQLYRLLDQTFYGKTIDQMVKLFYVLGLEVEFKFKKLAA